MVEDTRITSNVRVVEINIKTGDYELLSESHNLVLNSGFGLLVKMADGDAMAFAGIGVGSGSTAVQATDTWLETPRLVTAPTTHLYEGPLFRATLYLDETQLNGYSLKEIILAHSTTAPPTGDGAFSRTIIPTIAKTSSYAYLFIVDVIWGN